MKKYSVIRIALTSLFAIGLFIFMAFPYRAVLSYQEQFQLFLTDSTYFYSMIGRPGGLAAYLGEFLVQFYNNYLLGAVILALLLTLVQLLVCKVSHSFGGHRLSIGQYALTFVPVVGLWLYMGDTNVLLAFVVALAAVLAAAWLFANVRGIVYQLVVSLVLLPVCYWLFGPVIYMLALLMCVKVATGAEPPLKKILWCIVVSAFTAALVPVLSGFTPYSLAYQLSGIGYYRIPTEIPMLEYGVMALFVVTVMIASVKKLSSMLYLHSGVSAVVIIAATLIAAVLSFKWFYDPKTYELIDYDYLVRINNWQGIIKKAERRTPDLPMSVCATDLALGMTGQLADRAFEFYQHGVEGILPVFRKEPNSSLMTGEAYFHLGMINTAQRFCFEAMEAIPNYNKSTRCIKRLAETAIIRGDYTLARKYLALLSRTTFYRKWAKRMETMIETPGAVDRHPLYGRLRHAMIDDDFLYSETELDKIMGRLYLKDNSNSLARQYLMMYPLLQHDLDKFMQYMQVINGIDPTYNPALARQAAMLAYVKASREVPPGLADPMTMERFKEFARLITTEGKDSPVLESFRNTAWYYLVKGTKDE